MPKEPDFTVRTSAPEDLANRFRWFNEKSQEAVAAGCKHARSRQLPDDVAPTELILDGWFERPEDLQ